MKDLNCILILLVILLQPASYGNTPQSLLLSDSLKIVEKVYLHTDRQIYYPSEDIWFKAYLIDASDRLLTSHSTNLHVELISPDSKIIGSRITRIEDGMSKGDFKLPSSLKSGTYLLRSYTNYMRNFGNELFYNKLITIVNPADSIKKVTEDKNQSRNNLEVTFFPEGGSLIESAPSLVAFKVVDESGSGCDVAGAIYSSTGRALTTIKSTHKGMGIFTIQPEPGEFYYALVWDAFGDTANVRIPSAFQQGVVLNIVNDNQKKELQVTIRTNEKTLSSLSGKTLVLNVSSRSESYKKASFIPASVADHFHLPVGDLPDGIYKITLSNDENTPLCERLVYLQNKDDIKLKINTDKKTYAQRDSISVIISLADTNKAYLSLSATEKIFNSSLFPESISSWFLLQSDIRGNIEEPSWYFDPSNSYRFHDLDLLLLTQGWRDFQWKYNALKYEPEDGFSITGRVRKTLTDRPLKDAEVNIGIFKEGKPVICRVPADSSGRFRLDGVIFSGTAKLIVSTVDNKDQLKGMILIDSLAYKSAEITFNPALDKIQKTQTEKPVEIHTAEKNKYIQYAEVKRSVSRKYRLSDTIKPGEVTIIARKINPPESAYSRSRRYLMSTPDQEIIITPILEKYNNTQQLISFRLLSPAGTAAYGVHRMGNPLFMIDGVIASEDELRMIPVSWVERIDVANNFAAIAAFKLRGGLSDKSAGISGHAEDLAKLGLGGSARGGEMDGIISIITKSGYDIQVYHSNKINISGYDEPRVFYSPKHHSKLQSDYKPDLRATLFWDPDIMLEGNKQKMVNFYNTDNSAIIKITVEGITSTGIPVTATTEYEVR